MCKHLIIGLISLSCSFQAYSLDVIQFKNSDNELLIGKHTYCYTDSTNNLSAEDIGHLFINSKEKFKRIKEEVANFGVNKNNHWFFFTVNNLSRHTLFLTIDNPHIDYCELYEFSVKQGLEGDRVSQIGMAGDKVSLSSWSVEDRRSVFQLTNGKNEQKSYLLKIKKGGGLKIPLYIHTAKQLIESNNSFNLSSGIYFGVYVLLLFISIVVFLLSKDKVYLYFSFYIFSFSNYLFVELGYGYQFFWSDLVNPLASKRVAFAILTMTAIILFSTEFLRMKKHFPRVRKILNIVAIALLIEIIVFHTVTYIPQAIYNKFLPVNYVLILFAFIFLIVISIKSLKFQKYESVFLLFSIGALLIGDVVFLLLEYKFIPNNVFTAYSLIWSSLLDILLIASGLAFRINSLFQQKLRMGNQIIEQQKHLLTAIIKGEEKERKRLARELHDGISGNLVSLSIKINSDSSKEEVEELTRKTLLEVRNISHNLLPPQFDDLSIDKILDNYIESSRSDFPFTIQFNKKGDFGGLNNDGKITLYRIMQECISNAVKYAEAIEMTIQLMEDDSQITLMIEDNGIGFNTEDSTDGIGILNMKSRVADLQGEFTIDSSKEMGTSIIISLPISN
ncbi:MAG: signal transduction histidine kinase [Arenicella sp.]|jgi:signal transduction histidine kinase